MMPCVGMVPVGERRAGPGSSVMRFPGHPGRRLARAACGALRARLKGNRPVPDGKGLRSWGTLAFPGCRSQAGSRSKRRPEKLAGERQRPFHSSRAGEENGREASTTNITRASRSFAPLLETSIGRPGACPAMDWPASTDTMPCGVLWPSLPLSTKNVSEPGWVCTGVLAPGGPLTWFTRSKYSGALIVGTGPISAALRAPGVDPPAGPSVNNQAVPATSATSDAGPRAAVACASVGKVSTR